MSIRNEKINNLSIIALIYNLLVFNIPTFLIATTVSNINFLITLNLIFPIIVKSLTIAELNLNVISSHYQCLALSDSDK